ncbi:hypothetical protein [Nitrosovibrio tenuis]|uniref:Uncharacterized protein n=1 Tax=Nitrosovibrio tenuis TaxID=1233 RepID=A0A1H7IVA4_9PROT|nr:hypothetical protein [Nitrosovibrio tenuis]SEK64705.1 hypothetical protein SAMN05216387_102265 [Nitrosovibrio tenuis]
MAKYAHADVLDGGLNAIKNNAIRMLLLKAYSTADGYATVTANAICTVAMISGDYSLSGADGAARVLTVAAKSATASASSGASPNLHIAFTDNVSKVLWVTDETSDQVVTSGNTVNFPSLTYTSSQPT